MPKLKVLSGSEVIRIFEGFGFSVLAQRGSHVKLRRLSTHGKKQTLVVPNHDELDRGTIRAIYSQACQYILENDLSAYFYD